MSLNPLCPQTMPMNQVFFAVFTVTGTRRQTTMSPFLFLQRQISVNFVGMGLARI
jgi:hypothetical protein